MAQQANTAFPLDDFVPMGKSNTLYQVNQSHSESSLGQSSLLRPFEVDCISSSLGQCDLCKTEVKTAPHEINRFTVNNRVAESTSF